MILNVSGRTDIIGFYTPWFMNRLKEGFVDVRNPFYPKIVQRIFFKDVDAILFCTKNPIPILPYLDSIKIPFLFHITLTSYKRNIEPMVPKKREIIEAVKKISRKIGKDKVFIRYDPIFLSDEYTVSYHIKSFQTICELLDGYVNHVIVSFIDEYKNVNKNKHILKKRVFREEDYKEIGLSFSRIARNHGMTVSTCSEERNLKEYGFIVEDCISPTRAFQLTGKTNFKRWTSRKNKFCHCVSMTDIGVYNTCRHFCKYCYANYDENRVIDAIKHHDPMSSLLIGSITKDDMIREMK